MNDPDPLPGHAGMPGAEAPDFVTIAEAARRLGVDARQVRRYLPRLSPTDKGQDSQRTHKGHPVLLVRLSAVEALRAASAEHEAPKDIRNGQSTDRTGHTTDTSVGTAVEAAPTAGQLVPLYQRLLTEKDARISELTAALEHEREQSRTWREALAREQMMRALSAPVAPAQESPQEAPQAPQASEAAEKAAEAALAGERAPEHPQAAGRSWWRVWPW